MARVRLTRFPRSLARSALILPTRAVSLKLESRPKDHLPQEKITEGIEAVFVLQVQGFDDIPPALGHLGFRDDPVAMDVQVLIRARCRPALSMVGQ